MLISGSAELNILLANNNKVLNDVLKEADSKVFENIVKQDIKGQTTASEVIKELVLNLKDGSKSASTIENILKNSTIFKELGNVSTNLLTLTNLLDELNSSDTSAKFKPLIENLSKNIKDLDSINLKEQIKNSGVFLENKLTNNQTNKVETILKDIQNIVQTTQTPIKNQINEQINKILQDIQNPKQAIIQNKENNTTVQIQNLQNQETTATKENITNQTKSFISTNNQNQTIQILSKEPNLNIQTTVQTQNSNQTQSNQIDNNQTNQKQVLQNEQTQNIFQSKPNTQNILQNLNINTQTQMQKEPILNSPLANSLKNLTQNLETLSSNLTPKEFENLSNLTKELKVAINQGSLIESKFENISNTQLEQAKKPILNQVIQPQNQTNSPQNQEIQSLKQNIFNAQTQNTNQTLVQLQPQNQISTQSDITIVKNQIQTTQAFLNQIQNQISEKPILQTSNTNNQTNLQINNELNQPLINEQTPEEKAIKENISTQTKQLLVQIKDEIIKTPTFEQTKNILPLIENLLKMENLFSKNENLQNLKDFKNSNQLLTQNNLSTFSNNFSSNLSPILTILKENLESLSNPNSLSIQNHLTKSINKIEHLIHDIENQTESKTSPKDDMKSVLLQLKEELNGKNDVKSAEVLKQVDKILTQIDFYQLNSMVTNSNFVYVPFFWQMLEDGSISIKRAEEDKFYCQINLTLKDFGKVDLMLGLYDKNKMDLTIYAQRDHFKTAIKENIKDLKIALNSVDIIPVNIKLLDMKENIEDTPTANYANNLEQGISSGLNIKV